MIFFTTDKHVTALISEAEVTYAMLVDVWRNLAILLRIEEETDQLQFLIAEVALDENDELEITEWRTIWKPVKR